MAGGEPLWLAPYRLLYFFLYALGWSELLRPCSQGKRAGLGFVFWATTVREAVDRLLPVASVGGGVVGVRLLGQRGISIAAAGASVVVEILITVVALYFFALVGLILLVELAPTGAASHYMIPTLLLCLPVPVLTALLLRYGSVFARLQGGLQKIAGINLPVEGAVALDHEIRSCLRRTGSLLYAGGLQFIALISGSLEIWFVLRVVGHPIGFAPALIMESLMQAVRHLVFFVPAGIGVQEGMLIEFGQTLGVSSELALTVSLAKRVREILCGVPALVSWSLAESRHRRYVREPR
jgi:putative membrane protein